MRTRCKGLHLDAEDNAEDKRINGENREFYLMIGDNKRDRIL